MAYNLTKLVNGLKPEEIRGFRLQETRYNFKKQDKKLTLLFDAIKKGNYDEYDDKLMLKLFPNGNKNAYYRLKNLLVSRIEDSLVYLHRDKNQEFEVYKYLHLHQIFFHKSAYKEAHDYLKKAEKSALKLEDYDLLVLICRKYIYLTEFLEISPEEYIKRQSNYQRLATTTNETECLIAMLNFRLKRTNFSGRDNEVLNVLEQVSDALKLKELTTNSVRTKLLVNHCVRDILLQKKEFPALAEYMINSYSDFKKNKIFVKNNHEERIIQLSWIINSLTKIKNKDVPKYIDELHETLFMYNNLYYDKYMWLYYQSRVIEYAYSKKYREAIVLLQQLESEKITENNAAVGFYVNLNMTILYYTISRISNSLKYLSKILLSSDFNNMSSDWKLNIQLFELIIRIDNGDIEYAINKTNEIKRKYRDLLRQEQCQIEKRFIKITTTILKKPDAFKDENFLKEVHQFIADTPDYEPGSTNELINYSIWLQAKMQKKEYYSLIPNVF